MKTIYQGRKVHRCHKLICHYKISGLRRRNAPWSNTYKNHSGCQSYSVAYPHSCNLVLDTLSKRTWEQATSEISLWVMLCIWHAQQFSTFTDKQNSPSWLERTAVVVAAAAAAQVPLLMWKLPPLTGYLAQWMAVRKELMCAHQVTCSATNESKTTSCYCISWWLLNHSINSILLSDIFNVVHTHYSFLNNAACQWQSVLMFWTSCYLNPKRSRGISFKMSISRQMFITEPYNKLIQQSPDFTKLFLYSIQPIPYQTTSFISPNLT